MDDEEEKKKGGTEITGADGPPPLSVSLLVTAAVPHTCAIALYFFVSLFSWFSFSVSPLQTVGHGPER